MLILGYCLAFVCAWIYATNCVLNRALKDVHPGIVLFWHGLLGIILSLTVTFLLAGISEESGISLFQYDKQIYLLCLGGTLFDTLAVICFTIAFQSYNSGFVAMISYI